MTTHPSSGSAVPGVTIRPMAPADAERVSELCVLAYTGDYDLPESYVAYLEQTAERAAVADIYVAEIDDDIVGTVTVNRPGTVQMETTAADEVDFRMLAVDPTVRRRGVARALVDFIDGIARRRGASGLFLVTGPQMTAAQRLYERLGFTRDLSRGILVDEGRTILWAYARPTTGSALAP